MDYWWFLIKKDFFLGSVVNHFINLTNLFKFTQNNIVRKCMRVAKAKKNNTTAAIILNAPSINHQDLTLLKGTDMVFVNRGFMHPQYKNLHPKYHIICDPKFPKGIWPVSWIYDIVKMVPDITICLPVEWFDVPILQELKNNDINICWIRIKDKPFSPFVAGYSIQFLLDMGYKNIYFTGCEANGLGHELVKDTSHFYGTNAENNIKGTRDYIYDFYLYMFNYAYFTKLSKKCRKKNVTIVNLTIGGVLDMFERQTLDKDWVPKSL